MLIRLLLYNELYILSIEHARLHNFLKQFHTD
jgi:hypothetical protein